MMENKSVEVRYHMLRPRQIVARRKACPAAYIPIGTIEWHGVHNPVGADGLQAEGIAIRCAQKVGGVVFPPLYYGESRLEALIDSNPQTVEAVSEITELSPDNWGVEKMPLTPPEQALAYNRLLMNILAEVECLGFDVGVIVAGHYPLVDHARGGPAVQPEAIWQHPADAYVGFHRLLDRQSEVPQRRRSRRSVGDIAHNGVASGVSGPRRIAGQR